VAEKNKTTFTCPNCNALYQIVRQEAGPETVNREITCRACGGPLPNREGKFILKYFLVRKGGHIQRWRKSPLSPRKVFFKTGRVVQKGPTKGEHREVAGAAKASKATREAD
jgi:hypothetical protein